VIAFDRQAVLAKQRLILERPDEQQLRLGIGPT
jgi:hypothetical protein